MKYRIVCVVLRITAVEKYFTNQSLQLFCRYFSAGATPLLLRVQTYN